MLIQGGTNFEYKHIGKKEWNKYASIIVHAKNTHM